jgi:hypothetical protein
LHKRNHIFSFYNFIYTHEPTISRVATYFCTATSNSTNSPNRLKFLKLAFKNTMKKLLRLKKTYIFKGLAFETLDPWCKEAIDFINVIGNRLIAESGDSKSKKFLFERISLAIQRGNVTSIRGTFPYSALLAEIFVL